ncbi:MAG: PAS domain S-box protein [Candidatus Marinimicrobia bacterium]|nr:PAS domain S-box protein [Candidatus Neomarinimicrobiota bacterium]MCF7827425.1 PAS domain S-box protein [Candidatus Neomarinimicrobiota bacterium]MCF7881342.1 PAS domain S-box protein [Candidatus Neomarinimicrobiota bacterium]
MKLSSLKTKTFLYPFGFSLVVGASLWILDTVLDMVYYYEGPFLDLLFYEIPPHEIYVRLLILGVCAVAGAILGVYQILWQNRLYREQLWYSQTLHSIGDGVIATDTEGRVTYVNRQAELLTGWSSSEAKGLPIAEVFQVVNEETKSPVENPVGRVLKEGRIIGLANHTELLAKDGRRLPILDSGSPIKYEDEIVGAVLVFRDDSERRKKEKAIQAREKRLATLLQNIPGMAYRCINDQHWTMQFVSDGCKSLTGYQPLDLIQNTTISYAELIQPADRNIVEKKVQEAIRKDEPFEVEYRIQTKDGVTKTVWERGRLVENSEGHQILEGHISDVTKRREMETRYHSLFTSIWDAILIADTHRNIIDCNPAFEEKFGYSLEELRGHKTEYIYADHQEYRILGKAIQEHQADRELRVTVNYQTKSGVIFPGDTGVYFLKDEHGEMTGFIGVIRDVSQKMESKQAIFESETRFRKIFEESPVGMAILNQEFHFEAVNKSLCEMLEYSPTQLKAHALPSVVLPEDRESTTDILRKLSQHEPFSRQIEKQYVTDTDKVVWGKTTLTNLFSGSEQSEYLVMIEDVTSQKQSELALQQSRRELQQILDNLHEGIYRMSYDNEILFANDRMAQMLGYESADEIIGKRTDDLPFTPQLSHEKFQQILREKGAVRDFEGTWVHDQGWRVEVLENAVEVTDEAGNPIYYEGTVKDISEQKELEKQLIQSQKMEALGQIAGGIAHDFNNVLAAINSAQEILNVKIQDDNLRKYLQIIQSSVDRGNTVTKRMLTFTRPADPETKAITVSDFLYEIKEIGAHTLPKNVNIRVKIATEEDRIWADPAQLQQILITMCINAADAMPDGGTITLQAISVSSGEIPSHAASPNSDYLGIQVIDEGIGMDAETQDRIFEPFFTTKKSTDGTGLGLAIVQSIIRKNSGWITVESQPGKGTTFTLGLPKAAPRDLRELELDELPEQVPYGVGQHILYIEDEASIRELMREALTNLDYTVAPVSNASDALEYYNHHSDTIDLIVTDIGLPDMHGRELITQLRATNAGQPIVAVTGYVRDEIVSSLEAAGATRVFQKPINIKRLARVIDELIPE